MITELIVNCAVGYLIVAIAMGGAVVWKKEGPTDLQEFLKETVRAASSIPCVLNEAYVKKRVVERATPAVAAGGGVAKKD